MGGGGGCLGRIDFDLLLGEGALDVGVVRVRRVRVGLPQLFRVEERGFREETGRGRESEMVEHSERVHERERERV